MDIGTFIAPTDRFEKGDNFEVSAAPDGYIVHQVAKDRVHFLNEVSAAIFELCDGNNDVALIEEFIAVAFAKNSPSADAVRNCLSMLLAEELVRPCTSLSSGP